jgi:hypothetical protein
VSATKDCLNRDYPTAWTCFASQGKPSPCCSRTQRGIFDYVERVTFKHETVACQLRTASEVIRTEQISQIDLLKIDVEKGEWDVLLGIDDEDWNKIQQIVIEVHEIDNRLEKISRLLNDHGLNRLTVEQAPLFAGTHIFNLYGRRT